MIVVYHQNNKVLKVLKDETQLSFGNENIAENLMFLANTYTDELLIWCHIDFKRYLNFAAFETVFHHNKIMASYNPFSNEYLSEAIGYVEESPFIKINKKVTYPTWQMSSCVGGVYASVLTAVNDEAYKDKNFDYFLNSIAKLAMPKGLFCYSAPQLLINFSEKDQTYIENKFLLFRFVKQHYKTRWVFLLFLNLLIYERQLPLVPFIFSFFYFKRKLKKDLLDQIAVKSINSSTVKHKTIDVIIPTIGRKQYLYDVLKDLSKQTHLPKNVIIVEQNADIESSSELDYLTNEDWPFTIKHTFTHQTGVCNARNLALNEVESEWVFLNDDDNRFESDLIENVLERAFLYGTNCLTTSYIQQNEVLTYKTIHQSGIFGSGNSFLNSSFLKFVSFDKSLEFGYGEDTDFGLQLRNLGVDVIYFPELTILHLKAPMGGFRTKVVFPWETEKDFPKPSPKIMYVKRKHLADEQLSSYKTILFFKLHKINFFKIPQFNRRWESSVRWSKKI
ncbi:glycosyltransferase family A protein [Flavobacterium sp. MC2016-06]|jgi:GT2 family glycosyltransferase|uniref:glycosyltransferase family 2 protein n=1 Tax=Flavobacterium sp. MC2016-06 TaxID=2676308 RepID=UPI0012BAF2AF|nr:glycosyltransferase family A protein [Flavobacterium sp. MC2016-06]MBU3858679.1 glycosyltransferase family 2 protein [Flavobacterium sp. MC2016-06]